MEVSRGARPTPLRAPAGGTARLTRVGLFSLAPLLLASGAHLVGGGALPVVGVVLGAVALLLVSTLVSADRCRFAVLVPVLAAEQVLLHLLLTAADASAMCLPRGPTAATHAGHGAHVVAAVSQSATDGLQACAATHAAAMSPGWSMVAAHVVATLVVAWLLARGEAWWWRSVATLVRLTAARPTRRRRRLPATLLPAVARAARLVPATAAPRGPPLAS